jgi:hypothetical protein
LLVPLTVALNRATTSDYIPIAAGTVGHKIPKVCDKA